MALYPLDVVEESAHRRRQMGFVEHDDAVVAQQARVHRPARPPVSVTGEQDSGADHVDGADDDGRSGGIDPPLPVVGHAAAQDAEPDGTVGRERRTPPEFTRERGQFGDAVDPPLDGPGRLIDDGAPVDHVDDPRRERGVPHPREQEEQDAEGLAETGRDIHGFGDVPFDELPVYAPLPGIRSAPDDLLEVGDVRGTAGRGRRSPCR